MSNWDIVAAGKAELTDARAVGGGHEVTLSTFLSTGEQLVVVADADGSPRAVHRVAPSVGTEAPCGLFRAHFSADGVWWGAVDFEGAAAYVHQAGGVGVADASLLPFTRRSQRQAGGLDLFALQLDLAAGLVVIDPLTGGVYEAPPALGQRSPRVSPDAVFFIRSEQVDDPTAWVWSRSSRTFQKLLDGGERVVGDVHGDGTTLLWIETPPADPTTATWPPGTLYTSPYAVTASAIERTPRWTDLPVPPTTPTAMGNGVWAGAGDDRRIHILRVADGRKWSIPFPEEVVETGVISIGFVDETSVFFTTQLAIYRLTIADLEEGM